MSRSRGRGRSTVLVMTMCPGRALMTWILSARNAASRRSCVTRITVKPSFCQRSRSTHHNSSRVKASSAANGSSSINKAGWWIRARQSDTRCCMPPESSQGNRSSNPSSPTVRSSALACARYCSFSRRNLCRCGSTISSGSSTLSMTLRHGRRFGFWNAMPAIFTGPRTRSPKMTMSPESGGTSPVTSFINDDLPQPEGPTTAANSPRPTVRLVPFKARTPPDPPR